MKILFIGDIIGAPGRDVVRHLLPELKASIQPTLTIANGENSAAGFGLTSKVMAELFQSGIDVLTSGNHIWDKKQIIEHMDKEPRLLRPANYPDETPGHGWAIYEPKLGQPKIGVINLEGRVFMHPLDNPFVIAKKIIEQIKKETPIIFLDFHAEVTSEKRALGWYLDGQISALIGTHTHIQTADEEVLPMGTAYLTDAGMTGGRDSIIGVEKDDVIKRFLTHMPTRFTPAKNDCWLNGAVVTIDPGSGKALSIERLQRKLHQH